MAGWAGGVFTRARNWAQDKINLINPQAALFDQEDDNFSTGLNNCVTKDGTNKPSAAMDWNAQNLANIATLTAVTANITNLAATQGRGVMLSKFKTADTSRISTVTLTDDPHLASLALQANVSYAITLMLLFDATTTAGMGIQINLFYSNTFASTAVGGISGVVTGSVNQVPYGSSLLKIQSVSGTVSLAAVTVATASANGLLFQGILQTTAAGNLSMQWAQNSNTANNLNMRQGSYLTAVQIS